MERKKKLVIIIGVILFISIIVFLIFNTTSKKSNETRNNQEIKIEDQTPEAAKATKELISEVEDLISENTTKKDLVSAEKVKIIPVGGDASSTAIEAIVVNPGTNPINIETGKVITESGEKVVNDVKAGSPDGPKQSFSMDLDKTEIPKSAIKLELKRDKISPAEFTVGRGQLVYLVLTNTNTNNYNEMFKFDDPSLSALTVTLIGGETRSISFNAPIKAGEYSFYSNILNHRKLGAEGKMIVN